MPNWEGKTRVKQNRTTSHDKSVTIGDFYLASVSLLRHRILFKIGPRYTLENMFLQAVTEPYFLKKAPKKSGSLLKVLSKITMAWEFPLKKRRL
jgi:hypothetical protein